MTFVKSLQPHLRYVFDYDFRMSGILKKSLLLGGSFGYQSEMAEVQIKILSNHTLGALDGHFPEGPPRDFQVHLNDPKGVEEGCGEERVVKEGRHGEKFG